jgi:hypothetical protein
MEVALEFCLALILCIESRMHPPFDATCYVRPDAGRFLRVDSCLFAFQRLHWTIQTTSTAEINLKLPLD